MALVDNNKMIEYIREEQEAALNVFYHFIVIYHCHIVLLNKMDHLQKDADNNQNDHDRNRLFSFHQCLIYAESDQQRQK